MLFLQRFVPYLVFGFLSLRFELGRIFLLPFFMGTPLLL